LIDSVQVDAREVFRPAILAGATWVILSHNHPSGDPTPSEADRRMTKILHEAGKILNIPVADHIILGDEEVSQKGYYSFAENNLL